MAVYTTIDDAGIFFNPKLYTGNGVTDTAITGVGFQPDFVWFKQRSATVFHNCYDSVRGVQKVLVPNGTDVEYTDDETLLAFGADGFTIGLRSNVNLNTATYVAWNWKAGTTTGIAGSPSITPSSYSFNATSGFSVIAYTGNATSGATVPHGLGVVPKMIIVKELGATVGWYVYHGSNTAAPETDYLVLNTDAATSDYVAIWNDQPPTSTLFYLGNDGEVNGSGDTYIAYCFADVQGYSKFGGYTGNGNADGPFVYTGFRPALVLIKNATGSSMSWTMRGNGLNPYNPADGHVVPNTTAAEDTGKTIDILSNGFKARTTDGGVNGNGNTLVYGAWAEAPFVNAEGVPVNAR